MNRLGRKFMRTSAMASHEYQEGSQRVYALYIEAAQPPPHQLQSGILKTRKDIGGKHGLENVPFAISEMSQWEAQRGMHTDFSSKLVRELSWRNYEQFLNPLAIGIFQRRIRDSQINNPNLRSLGGLEQQMDALGLIGTLDGQRVLTNAAIRRNILSNAYIPQPPFDARRIADDVQRAWTQSQDSPYPSMMRGTFACNLLEWRDVAAVIAGVKPMAMVSLRQLNLLPGEEEAFALTRFMIDAAREYGFRVRSEQPLHPHWRALGAREWFVGNPEAVSRGSEAWLWSQETDPCSELARSYHRILGGCLGIPKAYVDVWVGETIFGAGKAPRAKG